MRRKRRCSKYARAGSAAKLEQIVRGWKHLSRDGELTAEEARHQSRAFSVVIDGDGMYVMRGRLEPEVGAVLMRAIPRSVVKPRVRTESGEAPGWQGATSEDSSAIRSRSNAERSVQPGCTAARMQRGFRRGPHRPRATRCTARACAAKEPPAQGGLVAEQALAAGFGGESGTRAERFQVAVHTEMATLEKDGEPGRSEVDGVRVSAESSRRLACDAAVVPMTHRDGEVMGVGRKTRTIPPHIRRALEERDRGCRYPGCGSRFTEAHHVTHWADGGETSLANTVLLCRRHHRVVHEGRTRMALNREGQAVFFTRKGKMIASAPPMTRPGQLLQPLPPAPPLPPGELYNGAARLVDSAIPWELEAAAREAVEEALDGEGAGPASDGDGGDVPSDVSAAKPGTPACRNGTKAAAEGRTLPTTPP